MSLPTDLARYRYDPLNRVIEVAGNQRFYTKNRLATEIQGAVHRSVFQSGDQLLAERGVSGCTLLATDQQRAVLHTASADKSQSIAYNVYGHRPAESGLLSLLGFNGERPDPMTGHYLLGNGYRAFNPVLMRFNSPDSWSPFGKGGFNTYTYCANEPVNRVDESGHMFRWFRGAAQRGSEAAQATTPSTVRPSVKPFRTDNINFNDLGTDALSVKNALEFQSKLISELADSAVLAVKARDETLDIYELAKQPLIKDALRARVRSLNSTSAHPYEGGRVGIALKEAYTDLKAIFRNDSPELLGDLKEAYDFVYLEFKELDIPVLKRKNTKIRQSP